MLMLRLQKSIKGMHEVDSICGEGYRQNLAILHRILQESIGISFFGYHTLSYNSGGRCKACFGHCVDGCRIDADESTRSLLICGHIPLPKNIFGSEMIFRYAEVLEDGSVAMGGYTGLNAFIPALKGEITETGRGYLFSKLNIDTTETNTHGRVSKHSLFVLPGFARVRKAHKILLNEGLEEALRKGYLHDEIVSGGLFSPMATQILTLNNFERIVDFLRYKH